jgi:alpha,alpha-trehalose phosphorylase
MRDHGEALEFSPRLPDAITGLSFTILRRGSCLRVEVTAREAKYSIVGCTVPLHVLHYGELLTVAGAEPVARPIPPLPQRERPKQPPGREPQRPSR